MKKTGRFLMLISCLFLLAAPAYATIWTDTHTASPFPVKLTAGGENATYDFTFDITKDGFDASGWPRDFALWYQVELYLADDSFFDSNETLSVTTDRLFFNRETDAQIYDVDFHLGIFNDPLYYAGNIFGLITLNANGTLGINLTATEGDFKFYSATVTASSECAPVPEPATMLLLGLGLVGLAGFGRKRFNS